MSSESVIESILFVEGKSTDGLSVVDKFLKDKRYTVQYTESGLKALHEIENNNYDLIVLGSETADLKGVETLMLVKESKLDAIPL